MKFFLFISAFALVSVAFGGETAEITTTFFDDTTESKEIWLDFDENGKATLEIAKSAIGKNVKYIDIIPSFSQAKVGDDGFFISSFGELTKFIPRKGKTTGFARCKSHAHSRLEDTVGSISHPHKGNAVRVFV